ncbi:hypothetical protein FN846DRAFT_946994 [Sphaerosporella brunnea]|uniref:Uncharacterized protein n=1 Tax=Sphaerosporella brunnea TaxID=1250544 RepID=A0A5J5EYE3_9PEZI|nr:hypothetical protein FN846DRAFT_946994 [Sphaerosporella brunnea]
MLRQPTLRDLLRCIHRHLPSGRMPYYITGAISTADVPAPDEVGHAEDLEGGGEAGTVVLKDDDDIEAWWCISEANPMEVQVVLDSAADAAGEMAQIPLRFCFLKGANIRYMFHFCRAFSGKWNIGGGLGCRLLSSSVFLFSFFPFFLFFFYCLLVFFAWFLILRGCFVVHCLCKFGYDWTGGIYVLTMLRTLCICVKPCPCKIVRGSLLRLMALLVISV